MASSSCLSTGLIGDTEGKPGPSWNGGDVGDVFSEINQHEVISNILCEFLEVAFHHILYIRGIYAATLFERRRKYNIPVYMSVHPELNQYIRDVLLGVKPVLDKGEVEKIILSMKSKNGQAVEKFVFHLQGVREDMLREDEHLLKLERDLRSVLLKISTSDASLSPLPPGCTFAILVHTTDSAAAAMELQDAITGFPWVKADESQSPQKQHEGGHQGAQEVRGHQGAQVTSLKVISSSILKMQLYVKELPDKMRVGEGLNV